MKFRNSKEQGGILLVVLLSSLVVCISLGSYLQYTSTQSRSIVRSQVWNSAIPIAEAGIEEGLAHINDSTIGTNLAINGWALVDGKFQKAGTLPGGRYVAKISSDTFPIVTCTGYSTNSRAGAEIDRTVEIKTTRWATGMKGIITKGDINMVGITSMDSFDSEDEAYSTRGRYDAAKHKDGGYAASVFGSVYGQTVYGNVGTGPNGTASGNVGSFGWLSTHTGIEPGHYANDVNVAFPEVQVPFDGGASSLGGAPVTLVLTNFNYWSTIMTTTNLPATTPASPITTNLLGTNVTTIYPTGVSSALIKTNFLVDQRSKTMPAAGTYANLDIRGAWYYYDQITSYMYPSVTYSYSMTATNTAMTTNTYTYVLDGDKYQTTHLRMSGGDKMLVLGTNVTLYVTQDFAMSGSSEVILAPGSSLKLYVGEEISLSGNGIFNYTLDATHLSLFGLPTNRRIDISGNAAFTGVIYSPYADINMNGGGSTIYDVVGAIIGNTATMNGHFQFHYDERLGRSKIQSKYSVASWREI